MFILGKMAETIEGPREELSTVRAADHHDPDRPREDRSGHRQGRRDDPRDLRGIRGRDRRRGRRHSAHLRADQATWSTPASRDRLDDEEAEIGDRSRAQGGQDDHLRRLHRADQGHRRPAAHLQRQAGEPVDTVEDVLNRATRSTSPSSRSTRSAAGSACASPKIPTSPASARGAGRRWLGARPAPARRWRRPWRPRRTAAAAEPWRAGVASAATPTRTRYERNSYLARLAPPRRHRVRHPLLLDRTRASGRTGSLRTRRLSRPPFRFPRATAVTEA